MTKNTKREKLNEPGEQISEIHFTWNKQDSQEESTAKGTQTNSVELVETGMQSEEVDYLLGQPNVSHKPPFNQC